MQGVTGTTGTLQTTGGTLDLRTNNSTAGTVNIGTGGALLLNNKSLTVSTDYTNSFGTGNSFTRTAGVTSGGASGVINAADIAGGATGANTFQQLSVNGGTTTATNTTLALGNIHVGNSISGTYNIYNKEAAGDVTLRGAITGTGIDSRLSGTGVDVTTSSWTAAANGNTGNKTVTLNGTTAGAVNSTVNIVNNFANTNSQALTITGGVYQYAQPTLSQSSVIFANRHVGDAASQVVSITNTNSGAPAGFQELLNASWSGSGATGSGSFSSLGVGSSSNITVGLNTIAAGNLSGFVTITPVSNGTGTSGLGNTTLGTQMVSVSGKVYQYAQPTFTGSSPVNFGIVHVGDTVSQAVGIANTSHAQAGYQEKLNASFSAATTGITTAGSTSLVQGASSNTLSVGIDTATAGSRSGTATVALVSDGADTSGLGTTNLASQNVSVLGQVNNYAAVGLTQAGGAGAFSGSGTNYVFNLGTITLNTGSAAGSLSLANTEPFAPGTGSTRRTHCRPPPRELQRRVDRYEGAASPVDAFAEVVLQVNGDREPVHRPSLPRLESRRRSSFAPYSKPGRRCRGHPLEQLGQPGPDRDAVTLQPGAALAPVAGERAALQPKKRAMGRRARSAFDVRRRILGAASHRRTSRSQLPERGRLRGRSTEIREFIGASPKDHEQGDDADQPGHARLESEGPPVQPVRAPRPPGRAGSPLGPAHAEAQDRALRDVCHEVQAERQGQAPGPEVGEPEQDRGEEDVRPGQVGQGSEAP